MSHSILRHWTIAAATACATIAVMPSAFAGINDDPPTLTVNYADLNMHSDSGAKALYRRLRTAAEHVCQFNDSRSTRLQEQYNACVTESLADAVRKVNAPMLSALHGSRVSRTKRG